MIIHGVQWLVVDLDKPLFDNGWHACKDRMLSLLDLSSTPAISSPTEGPIKLILFESLDAAVMFKLLF